jgi:hypothetical protein
MESRNLTDELVLFCTQHDTALAAFAGTAGGFCDDPGYILYRGELAPPEHWMERAGLAALVRFRRPPEWIPVTDRPPHSSPMLQSAAGYGVVVAWEYQPGVVVWHRLHLDPCTSADLYATQRLVPLDRPARSSR